MAITITKTTALGVHTIVGPGYWAKGGTNGFGLPKLLELYYIDGTASVPEVPGETIYISDIPTLAQTGVDVSEITANPDREGELFIRLLYLLSFQLDNTDDNFNLQEGLDVSGFDNNGRGADGKLNTSPVVGENHYRAIDPYDFAVLTGAINATFARLEPGGNRPEVNPEELQDKTQLKNVVRTLGIWGYIVDLFAAYVLDIQELKDLLHEWKPVQSDRQAFVYSYILPYLRSKGFRMLETNELIFLWDENFFLSMV